MNSRLSNLTPIRSRENILKDEQHEPHHQRRTKIVCSINEKTCEIDIIREMLKAGANALSINTAYTHDRRQYEKLKMIRDQLEQELDHTIPINMMLQGKITRIGHLRQPEIYLKKGNIIRITQDNKVIGDENIICVDQDELFTQAKVGDQIFIDYGQIVLNIKAQETDQEAKQILMEKYPDLYPTEAMFKNSIFEQDKSEKSKLQSKSSLSSENSRGASSTQLQSKKQKYIDQIIQNKKQKLATKSLIVFICEIEQNCLMRPFKPLFITNRTKEQKQIIKQSDDSDEEIETQITSKDINDFTIAKRLDFDSITLSNVSRPEEVHELKHLLGSSTNIQIFVRITTQEGINNFDKIMEIADGCIIARAYLATWAQIEDVVQMQHDMILNCRKLVKPVLISTQILESMLTQTNPTFAEMGDIADVVEQHIDGIMLSGETTYGNHPIKVVQALARISTNIEMHTRLQYQGIFQIKIQENPIASIIAQNAIENAYSLRVKLILLFTTGETALSLSKLHAPCPIVAVTAKKTIARNLNIVNGVIPFLVGSLVGIEQLTPRILENFKQKGWIKQGDYIISISGLFGTQEGIINQMTILLI
ncbi:unnamed protein product [Paramecium octaurelia]|uniref:Pyruvate kinase n=1 Tax=Paramecium octaurelia TaxID=43137 RepID=A0A8S1SC37_PAROT|nr:unnamed protein product [Paramecium octaurelia]